MSAKITAALHQVMTAVGYVQKTGKNAFHGYRYAGEADLLEKLRPAMIEAGLLLIPSVEEVRPVDEHGNTAVRVGYTLAHKDGDVWPHMIYAAGCGNDKAKNGSVGDKGVYKALTGANKYLLFKLFQIETGDDPEDAEHPEPAPRQSSQPQPREPVPPRPANRPITGQMGGGNAERVAKMVDHINASMAGELDALIAAPRYTNAYASLTAAEKATVDEAVERQRRRINGAARPVLDAEVNILQGG